MKPKKHFRQGDVLIVPAKTPAGCKPVPRDNGRAVLAYGEATGHAHTIADEAAELVTAAEAAELYLLVHGTEPVSLQHQEHATVVVPPGTYQVRRQREYAPEAPRFVAD